MSQLDLPIGIRRRKPAGDVSDEVIARLPNKRAALLLCMQVSGREDVDICARLDLDPAQLSRFRAGKAHFPTDKENLLMDFCENEIPLRWAAWTRGYELKRRLSEVEAENEALKFKVAELMRERETIETFMKAIGR